MLISLFITCYNDTLFPETGKAVVTVLERLGHEVEFREAQTCCGQMHYNTGYAAEALPLMRRTIEGFRGAGPICVPSASCVSMMRDHYPTLAAEAKDPALQAEVEEFLSRVYEFSELLVDKLKVTDVGAVFPHKVTLHTSCHSLRSLHLGEQPVRLLQAVRGLEFVALPRYDECCGFGGTFAVKNAEVSTAMGLEKVRSIQETGATVCAAGDNSCLMQIGGLLHRQGAGVRCMHLAEILASQEPETDSVASAFRRKSESGADLPAKAGSHTSAGTEGAAR
jgi:L-lactate dehydrogenase complex protein LldE